MSQFQVDGFAFVTGAAGGIGREVGFTFAEAGAKGVIFCDINVEGASTAANESKELAIDPSYIAISTKIDVTDEVSIKAAIDLAVKEFGRIDYCINTAGITVPSFVPFTETPAKVYEDIMDVNAKGCFFVSKAVGQVMQKQSPVIKDCGRRGKRDLGRGSIVNVASANAHAVNPAKLPYIVSKHAMTGITRCCAADGKSFGVRVNQLAPSWVRTPMLDQDTAMEPATPQIIESLIPLKRALEPDEVASAALYLCSPSAVYISGVSLIMDAGLTIGPSVIQA